LAFSTFPLPRFPPCSLVPRFPRPRFPLPRFQRPRADINACCAIGSRISSIQCPLCISTSSWSTTVISVNCLALFPMQQQHGDPLLQCNHVMRALISFAHDSLLPVSENKRPPFIGKSYINQEQANSTSGFDFLTFLSSAACDFATAYRTSSQ